MIASGTLLPPPAARSPGLVERLFGMRQRAPRLNLALQGGGAHGAFTWGVLDALLADPRIEFEGLSGSSAGAMNAVVLAAPRIEQLGLLRAHPDLGTRAQVSAGSASEQAGAGLNQLTQDEYDDLLQLNNTYRVKFGFPFLYGVCASLALGAAICFLMLRYRATQAQSPVASS